MARLSKEDWLAEGMKIIGESAQDKIKILYLCDRLKVTRGSFYHHFESIEDYVRDLMAFWQEKYTKAIIVEADKGATAEERMELLNQQVILAHHKVEAVIRSWSFYHPVVKECLQKVDNERLGYLKDILIELTPNETTAEHMATIDYAILIGIQQLNPDIQPEEMGAMYETYKSIFQKGH